MNYISNCKMFFIILLITIGCTQHDENSKYNFKLRADFKLQVPEPSGLALSFDGKNLWTVSDENSMVYLINNEGEVRTKFKVDGSDLEGICVVDDTTIGVILERTREIVILNVNGEEKRRIKTGIKGLENNGLEGITYDGKNHNFYLVNEKNPGLLIKLDKDFNITFMKKLLFAEDYSAIFFSNIDNHLWILSDESKLLMECDLEGNVLTKYDIKIIQAEGTAIDFENKILYVVSDKAGKLYVYDF